MTTAFTIPGSPPLLMRSPRLDSRICTVLLLFGGAALGAAVGTGDRLAAYGMFLYPLLYLASRCRIDTLSALAYYGLASRSLLSAANNYHWAGPPHPTAIVLWASLAFLNALPWTVLFHPRHQGLSTVGIVLVTTSPPLGFFNPLNPLNACGMWFPGSRWIGIAILPIVIFLTREKNVLLALSFLAGCTLVTHLTFKPPVLDPRIYAARTHFDLPIGDLRSLSVLPTEDLELQRIAQEHPKSIVILPESVIPVWIPTYEKRWSVLFAQLAKTQTALLIGTTAPIPNTDANVNILLSRGYSEHLSYVQRLPIPIGMWFPFDTTHGFPLRLSYPSAIRLWGHTVGILTCYEQDIPWIVLKTLARDPVALIAPSNIRWANGTAVPAIQHNNAQSWADLWSLPLYEAVNQ
ncbi:hypothetical protein [Acidisarcina polymorpha]|nr:hypothetical protein [Acidisarcina polymorpha]